MSILKGMDAKDATIPKLDTRKRITSFKFTQETFDKLDMLSRETGRSKTEIVQMLIKMAKVGEAKR